MLERRCELCGIETGHSCLYVERGLPRWYVDIAALPAPLPTSFTTGQPPNEFGLCLPRERWQAVLGKPGTRGIASDEIGVVESYLVDPHPVRKPWRE